jgi:hypothetical protein
MTTSLEIAVARRLVESYADVSGQWKTEHRDAQDRRACQEWMQKGIDAFRWLQRAEETLTQAEFHGVHEMTAEERGAIESLYVAWLVPCAATEEWINVLEDRGYPPENLAEFRAACATVRRIVSDRCVPTNGEPVSCADLALEDFCVTARDAETAALLVARKQARYRGTLSNHGIVEE